ncbi:metallophosphatase domain-containing protein [Terriglobus sp.]|uniref:metallophosphatase domain-containing protein n=1 Tax=Terriglobus sp. TaxID=1889013 RepID=UPI003B00C490
MSDLRLTILSDSHELHRDLDSLPGGDILIHCGDFSFFSKSIRAIEDFASWFAAQPYRGKLLTFGNHECLFEAEPKRRSIFERQGISVLNNEGVEISGLNIWASPVTPLYGGAFGLSSPRDREQHWAKIPDDTDILVTHGPPHGILDCIPGQTEHQGDPELLAAVKQVQPLLHVFGHVHGAYGIVEQDGTSYINAALLGMSGGLEHPPVHMRIPRRERSLCSDDDKRQPSTLKPNRLL